MPTELEELVEFLHHGNTPVRQIACENLVGFSSSPAIFKVHQLLPVKDLKLLVRDYPQIAQNALTILINLSHDEEVLANLAEDDAFLETILKKITDPKDPTIESCCMLLANLVKHPSLTRLLTLSRSTPTPLSKSTIAIDQLLDCFISTLSPTSSNASTKNVTVTVTATPPNPAYDYLSYSFASLSAHLPGRLYFLTPQPYDSVLPLTKLTPFTDEHSAPHIRRAGVASTIKNICFEIDKHALLLPLSSSHDHSITTDILPYILLPLCSGSTEDLDPDAHYPDMLPDLQLLPADKKRDPDPAILATHLETLLLLATTREARDLMRRVGVYPVVRECHAAVESEEVRDIAERLVQLLMRKEEGEEDDEGAMRAEAQAGGGAGGAGKMVTEVRDAAEPSAPLEEDDDDDDEKIVEIF